MGNVNQAYVVVTVHCLYFHSRDIASTLKRERKLNCPTWEQVFEYVKEEVFT